MFLWATYYCIALLADYIHCDLKNNGNVSHNSQSPTLFLTTSIFQELWDSQKTAPFFLIVLLFPLVNFKSPTFFTKFNALGTFHRVSSIIWWCINYIVTNSVRERTYTLAVGTISVLYLIGFITYKAIRWGFHMDFNVVPGSCEYTIRIGMSPAYPSPSNQSPLPRCLRKPQSSQMYNAFMKKF